MITKQMVTKGLKIFILTLFVVVFVFPLVWMFVTSTKSVAEIAEDSGTLRAFIPNIKNISAWLDPYKQLFSRFQFFRPFLNSVFYSFVIVMGSLFVNSLAGYALAVFDFKMKKLILSILLLLIIFPFQSMLVQIFLIINRLQLTNTVLGLALPHIGSAFYIYLFMLFFKKIPTDLRESAYLDGANEWQLFSKIYIPNSYPIFMTIGLLVFIGSWNDFVWPLMVFTEQSKYPLTVAINIINEAPPVYINQVTAGLIVTTIPILMIYIFAQKYIVSPDSSSGIK